ncbi:hypothetical protein JOL62DRAFT_607083 [Phyllosticta paracitricarpa]|uniref:Uncharacterized protein n=1 Tax=Phyllosticta paracitricarpa TaxID=2016321 RepID=A0ABR1MWZ2_9PEZI
MTPSPRPLSPRVAPGTAIQPGWLPPRTRTALGSDIPDRLETRIDVNRGRGAQRQSYTEYSERNLMVRAVTNVSTFYGRSFQSWVCCCLSAVVAATAKLVRMLSRTSSHSPNHLLNLSDNSYTLLGANGSQFWIPQERLQSKGKSTHPTEALKLTIAVQTFLGVPIGEDNDTIPRINWRAHDRVVDDLGLWLADKDISGGLRQADCESLLENFNLGASSRTYSASVCKALRKRVLSKMRDILRDVTNKARDPALLVTRSQPPVLKFATMPEFQDQGAARGRSPPRGGETVTRRPRAGPSFAIHDDGDFRGGAAAITKDKGKGPSESLVFQVPVAAHGSKPTAPSPEQLSTTYKEAVVLEKAAYAQLMALFKDFFGSQQQQQQQRQSQSTAVARRMETQVEQLSTEYLRRFERRVNSWCAMQMQRVAEALDAGNAESSEMRGLGRLIWEDD